MRRCAMILAVAAAACGARAKRSDPPADPPAPACDPVSRPEAGADGSFALDICTAPSGDGKTTITLERGGTAVWTDVADALRGIHVVSDGQLQVVLADGGKDWVVDLEMDDTGVKETNRAPAADSGD